MMHSTFQRNEYQREQAWERSRLSEICKLSSIKELFYDGNEPTFIVKNIKRCNPRPELAVSNMPFYPDSAEACAKVGEEKKVEKNPDVVLWVPMCCGACEERIKVPVSEMEGVKDVECNWYKKKVVVSGKALDALSILLKCQSIFCKAAFWKDD